MKHLFLLFIASVFSISVRAQLRTVTPCGETATSVPPGYYLKSYTAYKNDQSATLYFHKIENTIIVYVKAKACIGKIFKVVNHKTYLELKSIEDKDSAAIYFQVMNGVTNICYSSDRGKGIFYRDN